MTSMPLRKRGGRNWGARIIVTAVAAVLAVPMASGSVPGPGAGPVRLHARPAAFVAGDAAPGQVTAHDGKFWLAGRQIKLRGINVMPNWNGTAPTDADFARIASWGMNFVRFQVRWSFVEPTAPIHQGNRWIHSYDDGYLADLQNMVTWASSHGLSVLIDNAGLPGPDPIDDWWPQWLYQAPYNSHQKDYTNRDEANTD